jgi:hypothetical protein
MNLPSAQVVAPVLVAVVTAAGRRCECTRKGCHGTPARCERAWPEHRLAAAPRDVTIPAHAAWQVPVQDLAAWCERCHDLGQKAGQRERSAAPAAAAGALPLDIEGVAS